MVENMEPSMRRRSSPCLWTQIIQSEPAPCDRYKHRCCVKGENVYVLGGRKQNVLTDFWKYSVVHNVWTELNCSCEEAPDELEEHSMVADQGLLYVFGGMIDCSYSEWKTPLWLYDTDKEQWEHWQGNSCSSQVKVPVNRKGHSAVVFESAMYIYGGYIDIKGSSQDLWKFDFDTRAWSTLAPPQGEPGPGARYGHSAMIYQEGMYLFGGLSSLREHSDFWRWDFFGHTWCSINTRSGPPKMVAHSAVVYGDNMLLFGGGESQRFPSNCLWRFNFVTQTWEKLTALSDTAPPHKTNHCSVGLGPSFQPRTSSPAQLGETSVCRPKHGSSKLRPFKNRCNPSVSLAKGLTESPIELDTFCINESVAENSRGCNRESEQNTQIYQPAKNGTCLPFENHSAFRRDCKEPSGIQDSMVHHFPDTMLVIGGKPLSGRTGISVWQMTLTEL